MRRADAIDELDADFGVVARVALADVVEQRAEHEQIGAIDAIDQRGRLARPPRKGAGRR